MISDFYGYLRGIMRDIKRKILIAAATREEVSIFIKWMRRNFEWKKMRRNVFIAQKGDEEIVLIITGVGIHCMAYQLGRVSCMEFDRVINVGICGAFDRGLEIGETVIVKEDCFSEFGVEDGGGFLRASVVGLGNESIYPKKLYVPNILRKLRRVRGITVNTVHGDIQSIKRVEKMFQPQVETMEGAAFYYACNQNRWRCVQIRSVSNYVERRNKERWDIPLAIQNLNQILIQSICQ